MFHKTYSLKQADIDKKWLLIDAKDIVLGRLASLVAGLLRGKHKPKYTPHMDCGDNVIIVNAKHVCLTGNKSEINKGKKYYWHTGYPGGIKETTASKILDSKHPERVVIKAIKRMISDNKLARKQMSNLYVYGDAEHKHMAQNPQKLDIGSLNRKNIRVS
ncbi:MAG: 50S ribosomal protein L13 [Rickettsiales bacterium]|nr:50S ribosomal protein L13 [Rickettsiales bacterium]